MRPPWRLPVHHWPEGPCPLRRGMYLRPACRLLLGQVQERCDCPAARPAGGLGGRTMSMRAGIVRARPAGRIAAATAVLALLASLAGVSARPAAAGLVSGNSVPEITVLPANVDVLPSDTADSGTNYSPSMGQLSMHASFLFTAPVTGTFFCQIRAQTDAGNDLGYHMTVVAAPRPGGTWLEIDNFTDAAPLWWQINTCNSNGKDPNCVYLGRPGGSDHLATTI